MLEPYVPKRDVEPYQPICADIETRADGSVMDISLLVDGDYSVYQDWASWWAEIIGPVARCWRKLHRPLNVYAHNGANFDWLSLVRWLETQSVELSYLMSDTTGIGVNVKVNKHITVHLRDSARLLPASLKALSKTFGVDHGKLDIPMLPEPLKASDPEAYYDYLRNDTFALAEILERFWRRLYDDVGSIEHLPMTLPSLAMRLFRKTLRHPIAVPWNEKLKALERRAYTGGRTECFSPGEHDVIIDDCNSIYPSVMEHGVYPVSYAGAWTETYAGAPGLYEMEYHQTNRNVEPLLRDEASNEFLYDGRGVYTDIEIRKLLSLGGTFKLSGGYVYERMEPVFQDFVQHWWDKRLEAIHSGDEAFAYVAKILMNSLYGKFGQREEAWCIRLIDGTEQERLILAGEQIIVQGEYTLVLEHRRCDYTFVGIAARVTSYARVALYERGEQVIAADGSLVYMDTDSVHYTAPVELPTSRELGDWKREYRGTGVYLGRKLYALRDGPLKMKGIGRLERDPVDYQTLLAIWREQSSETIHYSAFPTVRGVLFARDEPCKLIRRARTIKRTANNPEQRKATKQWWLTGDSVSGGDQPPASSTVSTST